MTLVLAVVERSIKSVMVTKDKKDISLPCPCCGKDTIVEKGSYEICQFCGWEDDPVQSGDPDYAGGANKLSLNQYRKNYRER
jgi:predicted RNA-binding Zn-ribbon protein involved in translation (DUF1610 family)